MLLTFKLRNDKELALNNDSTDSEYITYRYLETLPNIDYWFVIENYYEGGEFLLIDKETGKNINVYGKPYFSKNNQYFVTYSFDIEASYNSNGFQLFKVENGKAIHLWTKNISNWGPSVIKWVNDSAIVMEQSRMGDDSQLELSYRKMKIVK